jgi:hypothetical protein
VSIVSISTFNALEVQILKEMERTVVEFVQKSPDGKF